MVKGGAKICYNMFLTDANTKDNWPQQILPVKFKEERVRQKHMTQKMKLWKLCDFGDIPMTGTCVTSL